MEVSDEPGIDDGDPLTRRYGGEQRARLVRTGGDLDVEAQRPQIAVERRSGYRLTGEDGGRQTNSLLGADGRAGGAHGAPRGTAARPGMGGGTSAEAIG
ncbi:hypothetical protein GCM10010272_70520 [Streptomyces lateritius]|nr:hypothetical protein GCM10010272_70520 [Streptomyces lateritius]